MLINKYIISMKFKKILLAPLLMFHLLLGGILIQDAKQLEVEHINSCQSCETRHKVQSASALLAYAYGLLTGLGLTCAVKRKNLSSSAKKHLTNFLVMRFFSKAKKSYYFHYYRWFFPSILPL